MTFTKLYNALMINLTSWVKYISSAKCNDKTTAHITRRTQPHDYK